MSNNHRRVTAPAVLAAALVLAAVAGAGANDDDARQQPSGGGQLDHGTVVSDHLLQLHSPSADALKMEGEQALHFGDLDKAVTALRKALELNPANIDSRLLYTEALEKRLRSQTDRDPKLYNSVLKQWAFIYKNSEFQDQKVQAQNHLQALTGSAPNRLIPITRYLAKVTIPEDGSTKVAFGKRQKTE